MTLLIRLVDTKLHRCNTCHETHVPMHASQHVSTYIYIYRSSYCDLRLSLYETGFKREIVECAVSLCWRGTDLQPRAFKRAYVNTFYALWENCVAVVVVVVVVVETSGVDVWLTERTKGRRARSFQSFCQGGVQSARVLENVSPLNSNSRLPRTRTHSTNVRQR